MSAKSPKQEFESLLLPLLDFLLSLAMQLTRNRDRAEDLVQEAVLKAARAFSTFREHSNFRAWMARILTNTFLTDQRRAKRWVDGVEIDDVEAKPVAPPHLAVAPIRSLEEIPSEEFSDEVIEALNALPEGMAVCVYLADVEELPYEEIAEIAGIPIGTVRSRVARGRRHLQGQLARVARDMGLGGGRPS